VETRVLNQAVRRNIDRFPNDFLFALSRKEILNLSQFVIGSKMKHSPNVFAFTEQGVAMLSSVLRSSRAVQVNIEIMRARRGGSACEKFCHHIKTCHASWRRWKRNTTSNSEWSLMPSVNSCDLYSTGVGVSASMRKAHNIEPLAACDGPGASSSSISQIKFNAIADSYLLKCLVYFQS
jgi:hypothetical protein